MNEFRVNSLNSLTVPKEPCTANKIIKPNKLDPVVPGMSTSKCNSIGSKMQKLHEVQSNGTDEF